MHNLDLLLWAVLAAAVVGGSCGVWCVRGGDAPRWGRCLFLICLLALGMGNVIALHWAARCLVPYGLSAGWLVIAMLWENPFRVG